MTLNEVNIIKNSVLDATEAYVDARLNSSDFVKTQIGVTSGNAVVGRDGKYRHTVICNRTTNSQGVTYNNVLSVGNISFPPSSVVFMIIPNAQASNQFILGKLDTSPCNIEGGSIDIGNGVFTVNNQGVVNIERGAINLGKQTDNTYNFSVTDGGIVTIKNGEIKLTYDNTLQDYNFKVNSNGINLGLKGTTSINKYYNFIVDNNGQVTIKDGNITLGTNKLKIDSTGWLAIGGIDSNAPFYVDNTGRVDIKNGSINIGFISNNKYNFSVSDTGVVYIRNGSILLGETSSGSNNYNVNINSTGLGLGYNSLRPNDYNFTVDTSGNMNMYQGSINLGTSSSTTSGCAFYVDTNGYLESVNGTIGGFTITSDHIGDEIGSDECVGMEAGRKLFAYDSSGSSVHKVNIFADSIDLDNAHIFLKYGSSNITITSQNIENSNLGYVVWHDEIDESDKRLKKKIRKLSLGEAKDFINGLIPKEYTFKKKEGRRYGFIAQEVESLLDDDFSVVYDSTDKYKHLHYQDIISPLVKVVQNQQKEIEQLKQELKEIRKVK